MADSGIKPNGADIAQIPATRAKIKPKALGTLLKIFERLGAQFS